MQGGMIGEAEIVAIPDDAGSGGLAGHQGINSDGGRWVRGGEAFATLRGEKRTFEGHARKRWGAQFGFFCYATFELTSLSLLKH